MNNASGFTLIEMIIAIVVLAAGVSGILFSFTQNIGASADPMIRQQAIIIAQGYLEEAMLKPYSNPDAPPAENNSCEGGETRITYDDVADYNCIADVGGAVDQFGNVSTDLTDYNIAMTVAAVTIGVVNTRRIDVTVTHTSNQSVTMTAYRASYY